MIIFFIIVIIILLIIIFIQNKKYRHLHTDLKYIQEKLNHILTDKTEEQLLVFAADKSLIPLLVEINHLLDYNQISHRNFLKAEISMRKMLSNISHDLKTPLTVILGYIETIKLDKTMDPDEREVLLTKVENKTAEVLELINKFFDLAKLESGDKVIPLKPVNINEICRKSILSFYDILTNKGFQVIIEIPEEIIYSRGNEEALDRVMNNLLSNSIKYGNDGMIVGLSLKADEEYVYIEVWDKGKGIGEIYKDRIFERMYTLEDSRNKQYQGSGLGLTITKRLVEKMDGEIVVNSKPKEKTSFTVKLKRIRY